MQIPDLTISNRFVPMTVLEFLVHMNNRVVLVERFTSEEGIKSQMAEAVPGFHYLYGIKEYTWTGADGTSNLFSRMVKFYFEGDRILVDVLA